MKKNLLSSKVGIVFPTCSPYNVFKKFLPTIKYIKEIAPMSIWLVNFNGDNWTLRSMVNAYNAFEKEGFRIRAIHTTGWDKPVKLVYMRELCARQYPDCDMYLFIDDDFRFVESTVAFPYSSGERYLQSIDYMTRHPKCGAINTKSFFGGAHQRLKIAPTADDMYATNRGMFLRNMRDYGYLLYPDYTLDLRGGLEETLAVMLRIERGFFAAKQMCNPTIHVSGQLSDYGDISDDFHNKEVIDDNIAKFIRDMYSMHNWDYEAKKFPIELWERYHHNDGITMDNLTKKSLTIDYAKYYSACYTNIS